MTPGYCEHCPNVPTERRKAGDCPVCGGCPPYKVEDGRIVILTASGTGLRLVDSD